MPRLYPIYADLADRPVLVVGGGPVAARKVSGLLESRARITVVAPQICAELGELSRDAALTVHRRTYRAADLDGQWLVIAATDAPELNESIFAEAERRRVFCNVVDQPGTCTFHVPAVVRRGLLQIAISTGGASPALAKRIRKQLETQFGPPYERFLEALRDLRAHLRRKYPQNQARRQRVLESFIDSSAAHALSENAEPDVLASQLERWKSQ